MQVQRTGLESVEDSDREAGGAQASVAVGVNCAMGRHRSVAFVEELSKRKWPRDWVVVASHRDVDKPRGHGKKGRGSKHAGREVSD
ncbi:hypothetical protein FIBSPDRAFT_876290 [Athelia psychrophila]|uniref:RapZ C-terminal domain-containing protein n=1 Tax=Athelia psychrophila TaxID=1759441 RepID=A0A167X068_9AGAM|nr:hypothetical protein FIBSPDRAFT_876290 [Fibularhizoctonia sp. CBS 109695]